MKRGITLIECMVYLAVCGIICILVAQLVGRVMEQAMRTTAHFTTLYVAGDTLMNDVGRAIPNLSLWQVTKTQLRFSTADERLCWKFEQGKLLRTTHRYDSDQQKKYKATVVVAKGIDAMSWHITEQDTNLIFDGFMVAGIIKLPYYCVIRGRI